MSLTGPGKSQRRHSMTKPFYAIVPAGGSGTRLWPLSRAGRPKFLLPLPGPRTMIQETVERLKPVCNLDSIFIMTGTAHATPVARQIPDLPEKQIIVEPFARGSGPAIGLGVALAAKQDPDAIVGSFAADHHVERPDEFVATLRAAIEVAEMGYLVTIGIEPKHAETGYGYIRSGEALGTFAGLPASSVQEFKEKPDLPTAQRYVESGEYLWNASMFVWKASIFMEELRRLLPEIAAGIDEIVAAWDSPERDETLARVWAGMQDITIDHGILERSDNVAVVPGSFGWSDLGDWHGVGSLIGERSSQPGENVIVNADVITVDATNAVVFGNGRQIAIVGFDDAIVVDTHDALLVCRRSHAQNIKAVVDELKQRGSTDLI
jgi:mannose-1-phosphate guanylyltransferase